MILKESFIAIKSLFAEKAISVYAFGIGDHIIEAYIRIPEKAERRKHSNTNGQYDHCLYGGIFAVGYTAINDAGDAAEKPKGIGGLFWNAKKAVSDMQTKYDKVEVNVDAIASSLEFQE